MLTQKRAEQYRKTLNISLKAIAAELAKANAEKEKREDNGHSADWTDAATIETTKTMEQKIRDREKQMLEEIHYALQRIENKTFGECHNCGDEISESRLKARPTTTLCIDCMIAIEASTHRYR